MAWTHEEKLEHLLRLPWAIRAETSFERDRLLRVVEIPSAVGCGATDAELEADLWASLQASLEAYLHFDDPIPVPAGTRLPWEHSATSENVLPSEATVRRRVQAPGAVPLEDSGLTGSAAKWREAVLAS